MKYEPMAGCIPGTARNWPGVAVPYGFAVGYVAA